MTDRPLRFALSGGAQRENAAAAARARCRSRRDRTDRRTETTQSAICQPPHAPITSGSTREPRERHKDPRTAIFFFLLLLLFFTPTSSRPPPPPPSPPASVLVGLVSSGSGCRAGPSGDPSRRGASHVALPLPLPQGPGCLITVIDLPGQSTPRPGGSIADC